MNDPEQSPQPDPRLEDPDKYFGGKYSDVEVKIEHNGMTIDAKLGPALEDERKFRTPKVMDNLTPDKKLERAIYITEMLRKAGKLDPVDDMPYPEVS